MEHALVVAFVTIAWFGVAILAAHYAPKDTGTYLFPPTEAERAADEADEARERARQARAKQMASPAMQRKPAPWFQ